MNILLNSFVELNFSREAKKIIKFLLMKNTFSDKGCQLNWLKHCGNVDNAKNGLNFSNKSWNINLVSKLQMKI